MWETGSRCPATTQRRATSAGKPLRGVQCCVPEAFSRLLFFQESGLLRTRSQRVLNCQGAPSQPPTSLQVATPRGTGFRCQAFLVPCQQLPPCLPACLRRQMGSRLP